MSLEGFFSQIIRKEGGKVADGPKSKFNAERSHPKAISTQHNDLFGRR